MRIALSAILLLAAGCPSASAPDPVVPDPGEDRPADAAIGRDRGTRPIPPAPDDDLHQRETRTTRDGRVVIVETRLFIFTRTVDGLYPDDPDAHLNLTMSECLTALDPDHCCWIRVTGCAVTDGGEVGTCRSTMAHGCYAPPDDDSDEGADDSAQAPFGDPGD